MKIQCPCGKVYAINDDMAGKKIRCKLCQQVLQVPFSDQPIEVMEEPSPPPTKETIKPRKKKKKRRPNREVESSIDSTTIFQGFKYLGIGLFCIAVGIGLYFMFAHWEEDGGRLRMRGLFWLIYSISGKLGTLLICCGIGLLFLVVAAMNFLGYSTIVESGD